MNGQNRKDIKPGLTVDIVLKADQPTGKLTRGVVGDILTSKLFHPRGIKVRLTDGQVGRVQHIVEGASLHRTNAGGAPPRRGRTAPRARQPRRFAGAGRGTSDRRRRTDDRADRLTVKPAEFFACPCCGYLTLEQKPPGTYEICPVCYWEDDPLQFAEPDNEHGGNGVSLNQARKNFAAFGACEERYAKAVRPPTPAERVGK